MTEHALHQHQTIIQLTLFGTFHAGKEKLLSFKGSGEATRSGERTECEAPDGECDEVHATLGAGSISNSVSEDPNVRKPSQASSSVQE